MAKAGTANTSRIRFVPLSCAGPFPVQEKTANFGVGLQILLHLWSLTVSGCVWES